MTQDEFEQLIGRQPVPDGTTLPHFTIIYFGATWCGPCQRLDMAGLEAALPQVNWLKCDIDQNKYTPGYCGIRSIPSFLAVVDTKIVGQLQSSDTNKVAAWVQTLLEDAVEPQG
jgi:thioredoxin-like negative regulator of GroEL